MPARLVLTDESGRWFDTAAASAYAEPLEWSSRGWAGRYSRSTVTRTVLYRTQKGAYVVKSFAAHAGYAATPPPTVRLTDNAEARRWFNACGLPLPPDLVAEAPAAAPEGAAVAAGSAAPPGVPPAEVPRHVVGTCRAQSGIAVAGGAMAPKPAPAEAQAPEGWSVTTH